MIRSLQISPTEYSLFIFRKLVRFFLWFSVLTHLRKMYTLHIFLVTVCYSETKQQRFGYVIFLVVAYSTVGVTEYNLFNFSMNNCCTGFFFSFYLKLSIKNYCLVSRHLILLLDLFLGAFAKLRKATVSFVVSVRPHGTTRLALDGFNEI